MKKLWIMAGMAAFGFIARGDSLDDEVREFSAALKSNEAGKAQSSMGMNWEARLEMSGRGPGSDANLAAIVTQLMASDPSPAVQKAGQALLADLEARKKARVDAAKSTIDAVLAPAPAILVKAQKTDELDALLADLQKAQVSRGYDEPELQAQMARLNTAYQFVASWQDYLSARNSGNLQAAQDTLRNLLNSQRNGEAVLVPRSEILARSVELAVPPKPNAPAAATPPPVDVAGILDGIKTLDDMEPALKAMKAIPNSQSPEAAILSQYVALYAASKSGLPASFDLASGNNYNGAPAPELERIRAMVILYLLPGFLGNNAPTTRPGETVSDYLARAITDAATRQDWSTLQHIIEAETRIARAPALPSGTRSFLAALNQETAGQFASAVTSYQSSLRDPDDFVPAKMVGDRLAAIKKDHPAEYEEGMKAVNNPPPMPAYMNPLMMRAMMMQGYPMPGAPSPAPVGHSPTATPAVTPPAITNAAPVTPAK